MDNWKNILEPEILKFNMKFASLFVLYYESLKDYIVTQIKDFYSIGMRLGEENQESEKYKKEVRRLDKHIDNASFLWFVQSGAVCMEEYSTYQKIRSRRNEIVHNLLEELNTGFKEEDGKLLAEMIGIYNKIDKWWINEIEIPISGDVVCEDYNKEDVCGGQAMILNMITDVVLDNNTDWYNELREEMKKVGLM